MFLAGFFVGVDEGEDCVQVGFGEFTEFFNEVRVVGSVDGEMVTGVVPHLGSFDVKLDVHAGAITGFVEFTVDEDFGEEGVFSVVGPAKN